MPVVDVFILYVASSLISQVAWTWNIINHSTWLWTTENLQQLWSDVVTHCFHADFHVMILNHIKLPCFFVIVFKLCDTELCFYLVWKHTEKVLQFKFVANIWSKGFLGLHKCSDDVYKYNKDNKENILENVTLKASRWSMRENNNQPNSSGHFW